MYTDEFFDKLDEQKTLDRVARFFADDLDRLLALSGNNRTYITSPNLEDPGASSNTNSRDALLINGITTQLTVDATVTAINHCSYNSQIILKNLLINKHTWAEIERMLYSSHSKVASLRRKALFEFADNFIYEQVKLGCQPVVDLHIYEQTQNKLGTP